MMLTRLLCAVVLILSLRHTEGASGCSDGTREAFIDEGIFPNIAACSGGFSVAGLQITSNLAPTCNRGAGNDGSNPTGSLCSAADLCAPGWHVCDSPDDVLASSGGYVGCATADYPTSAFFATRTSGHGDGHCDGGDARWANDIFGCGTLGDDLWSTSTGCGSLNKFSNNQGIALNPTEYNNPATTGWYMHDNTNIEGWSEAYEVRLGDASKGGVMCCSGADASLDDFTHVAGPVCEGGDVHLICPPETSIHIISAVYGRNDAELCPYTDPVAMTNTACALDVTAIVAGLAEGDYGGGVASVFAGNNDLFTDPCYYTYKTTTVEYSCARCPLLDGTAGHFSVGGTGVTGAVGSVAVEQCLAGYRGSDRSRTCQSDGTWSGVDAICKLVVAPADARDMQREDGWVAAPNYCGNGTLPQVYTNWRPSNSRKFLISLEGVNPTINQQTRTNTELMVPSSAGSNPISGPGCNNPLPLSPGCNQQSYVGSGILSSNSSLNTVFWDFNKIFLHHCSGDAFQGRAAGIAPQTQRYHRGYYIFWSVLQHLFDEEGMDTATEIVLFGGVEAGCVAASRLADEVLDWVTANIPTATFKVICDNGDLIPGSPFPGSPVLGYQATLTTGCNSGLWNLRTIPAFANAGLQCWQTYFSIYTQGLIAAPVFWSSSSFQYTRSGALGANAGQDPAVPPSAAQQQWIVTNIHTPLVNDFINNRDAYIILNTRSRYTVDRNQVFTENDINTHRTRYDVLTDWYTNGASASTRVADGVLTTYGPFNPSETASILT